MKKKMIITLATLAAVSIAAATYLRVTNFGDFAPGYYR